MATQNASSSFQQGLLPSPVASTFSPEMLLPDDAHISRVHDEDDQRNAAPLELYQRLSPSVKLSDAPSRRESSLPRTMTPASTVTSSHGSSNSGNGVQPRPYSKYSRSVDVLVAAEQYRSRSGSRAQSRAWTPRQQSRENSPSSVRTAEIEKLKASGPDTISHAISQQPTPRPSDESERRVAPVEMTYASDLTKEHEEEQDDEPIATTEQEHEAEEEEEERDTVTPLPTISAVDDEDGTEDGMAAPGDDVDLDEYTHNALSKRAEQILENAKKRLHLMEDNLRGARTSLTAPPSALQPLKLPTELSASLHILRERDRRLYGGMGYIPPRHESPYTTPLTSPSHSRGLSETFTPSSLPGGAVKKIHYSQKRASSALNVRPPWSPPADGTNGIVRRLSIRASRSQEQMRNDRLNNWQLSPASTPLQDASPLNQQPSPTNLDPLPEDAPAPDTPSRPASTTSDLRLQLNDLKGRISSLKERAKEDNIRRRSVQSLRTPSPFTQAESWYANGDAYQGNAINTDAGIGARSPVERQEEIDASFGARSAADRSTVIKLDGQVDGASSPVKESHPDLATDNDVNGYADHAERRPIQGNAFANGQHEGLDFFPARERTHSTIEEEGRTEEGDKRYSSESAKVSDTLVADDDDPELGFEDSGYAEEDNYADDDENYETADADDELLSTGDTASIYEDASWEPVAERHEDRVDAFDYENFFLHSAMGTYNAGRPASSAGSQSDAETERAPTPPPQQVVSPRVSSSRLSVRSNGTPIAPSFRRHGSVDSISTMQSFATAAEGRSGPHSGRSTAQSLRRQDSHPGMQLDTVTEHLLARHNSSRQTLQSGFRSDSAVLIPPNHKALEPQSPTQAILSVLQSAIPSPVNGPRPPLDEQDKELITSLAASLETVFLNLNNAETGTYDKKLWRRRLDDARRMLEGEGEEEAF